MTETERKNSKTTGAGDGKNRRLVIICLSMVAGMTGMAYAAVPLYDLFCRVTGYGGTTQVASADSGVEIVDRAINVRFDANVAGSLDWDFKPVQREVSMKLGESTQIAYRVINNSSKTLTGTATFNVTPQSAGAYFNKIQCFCFTENTLEPGEELEMPVVFFVDPAILEYRETRDIETITLSYTFFPKDNPVQPVANFSGQESRPESGDEKNKTLTNGNG